jgi:DNA-binding CsgD family transcriptional regulator
MTREQIESLVANPGVQTDDDGMPWAFIHQGHTPIIAVWRSQSPYPPLDALRRQYGLTPTQARVAQLLYVRRTNEEIRQLLGVSIHTARRHVEAVLLKVGVPSRWAVERALAQGAAEQAVKGLVSAARNWRMRARVRNGG